jgi:hypothetical protein
VSAAAISAPEKRGGFFDRNAWKVFATLSSIIVLFGVGDIAAGGSTFESGEVVMFTGITGTTWSALQSADPGAARLIDAQVRAGGTELLLIGLLSLAICITGFRSGQRWAWYAMWLWPIWLVLVLVLTLTTERLPGSRVPVPIISGVMFLVICVATLMLSYRRYAARA